MATDVTAATPHDTAPPGGATLRRWGATYLPWRPVVVPWIVARIVVVATMSAPGRPRQFHLYRLIALDGQWYRLIATDWYDGPYHHGVWSTFPFFPLYPALVGGLIKLGAPQLGALVVVSWIASLAAIAGAHRLAVRHLPPGTAPWATWFLTIAPGAVTMVLGYSDSLYLAGLVWALVLAEDRRWWAAGVLAAVATAARPNGWIAVVAVVITVWSSRAGWRALLAVVTPAAAFLVGWCTYLWSVTGNPLVFYDAKSAWNEVTIGALVTGPLTGGHPDALFQLSVTIVLLVPFLLRIRSQPPAWISIVVLGVLPSFLLGLEGLARYTILAFPLPFAAADVLASRGKATAAVGLGVSAAGMIAMAYLVVTRTWLP